MGYVENNLLTDERIVYRAHLHWSVYAVPVLVLVSGLALVIASVVNEDAVSLIWPGLLLLVIGAITFVVRLVQARSAEFVVTNRRVLIKIGFISRQTVELLLQQIEGIGVDQTLGGRVFNYGTISVTGTGGTKERFPGIGNPLEFRRQVQNQTSQILVPPHQQVAQAGGTFCTKCGAANPRGANFCNACGERVA